MTNAVDELLALKANWDGYGALPISAEVGARVKSALAIIVQEPEVVPNTDGTITLEWHSNGYDLEIEIGKTRTVIYFQPVK